MGFNQAVLSAPDDRRCTPDRARRAPSRFQDQARRIVRLARPHHIWIPRIAKLGRQQHEQRACAVENSSNRVGGRTRCLQATVSGIAPAGRKGEVLGRFERSGCENQSARP